MTDNAKDEKKKRRSTFRKTLKYILLILILAIPILFLFFRERDVATGMLEKAILTGLSSAGLEGEVGKIEGNPWKGYRLTGLSVGSDDIFSTRIEEIKAELDLLKILKWDPVKKIGIYHLSTEIIDPAKLSKLRSESSEGRFPIPPLPLEMKDFRILVKDHQIDLTEGKILLSAEATNLLMEGSANDLPWKVQADLHTGEKTILQKCELYLGTDGHISLSGDIAPEIALTGTIENINMADLGKLDEGLEGSTGMLSSTILVTGSTSEPEAGGSFTLTEGMLQGTSLGNISGNWSFAEDRFSIREFVNEIMGSTIEGDFSISTEGELSIKVEGRDLDLAEVPQLKVPVPEMKGKIDTLHLDLSGRFPGLEGKLDLSSRGFTVSEQRFDSLDLKVLLKDNILNMDSSLLWSGTKATAKGDLHLTGEREIDFDLKAPRIDLKVLPSIVPALSPLEPEGLMALSIDAGGNIKDPRIRGTLSSKRLSLRHEPFENMRFSFSVTDGTMTVSDLYARTLGGEIKGSGNISNLLSDPRLNLAMEGKGIDLSRTSNLIPSPPEKMEGMVDLDLKISGSPQEPVIQGNIRGNAVSVGEMAGAETIEASLSIKGKGEPRFEITTPLVTVADMVLQDVNARLSWKDPDLIVQNMTMSILDGEFEASGKVRTSPSPFMDLRAEFRNLELEDLPFSTVPDTRGTIGGDLRIKGPPSDPELDFRALSPLVTSGCASLQSMELRGQVSKTKVDITSLSARVGEGLLKGGMSLLVREKGTNIYFNLVGSRLDLASLLPKEEEACPVDMGGSIDLVFQGDYTDGKLNGDGSVTSEALSIQDVPLENINIPVDISGNNAEIKGMKINSFKGIISGDLAINLDDLEWNTSLKGISLDLGNALGSIPDLSGKFNGTGFFELKARGKGFNPYNMFGHGLIDIKDGDIGGIPSVKAAAATTGQERIEFRRLRGNFMADGFGITILGGSRMEAPRKYPLYRLVEVDGNVQYDGDLNLRGTADVNIQALNAFTGALQVALKTALSQGDLVGNLLGGLKGAGKKDFRTVIFEIGGNRTAPEIKKLEVQGGQEYLRELLQMEDKTGSDRTRENKFNIRIEFPVGPGGAKDEDTAGEQIQEQVIEGILKNLFPSD